MTPKQADDNRALAYASYQKGDPDTAQRLCRDIVSQFGTDVQAIYLLGAIALERRQLNEALDYLGKAVRLSPGSGVMINALGEAQAADAQIDAAMESFRKAIAVQPGYERAHNNLGMQLFARREVPLAIASFSRAIELNPRYPTAHNNLGAAYQFLGKLELAESHFRKALAARPQYPEANFNLATVLHNRGDLPGASIQLRFALEQRPGYARAVALLGRVLSDMGKLESAVGMFARAVELDPCDAPSWLVQGNLLRLLNRLDEAGQCYERALALNPNDVHALAGQLRLKDEICDWSNREVALPRLMEFTRKAIHDGQPSPVAPLHAASLPFSAQEMLHIAQSQAKVYELRVPPKKRESHPADGRLRVGYLSRDLYDHPVAHQIAGLFPLHDRARFEIHVYSTGPNDSSVYRRSIAQTSECFHDVATLSAGQLVERIAGDQIDILVDLMGHTGMARMESLAARPAPIIMTWLGFPGTTGASFVDYVISDAVVTPQRREGDYSEKVIRLPGSFMITDSSQPIAEVPVHRSEHQLPEDAVVFACFNSGFKIEPTIFAMWMEILQACPGSVLWLSIRIPEAQENLKSAARSAGIDESRLVFARRVEDKALHLARLRLADLFLDTHFYNAHATACDWLWACVPVLTWPGETFASRVGASLVSAMGMEELIAADAAQYVRWAIELAHGREQLQALKTRLKERRTTSRLFDTAKFTRSLERAFEAAHQKQVSGERPTAIDLEG